VLLNLYKIEVKGACFSSIKGDACNLEGMADKSFDFVFSNSVIEHLFSIQNQQKMANEVKRVGKNYYIQTPNKFFPIEPHWVFPFFQFLPFDLKVYLTKNFNLGHIPKAKNKQEAIDLVNEVNLLSKKELESLFSESRLFIEKFMGFHKSYAVYKIEN
jgi:ubiquinone/menaquinone biosynthesis C-methylase UbiE